MLTIQQLAEIAARHETAMADAMLAACAEKALETGERLSPVRRAHSREHADGPGEEIDWDALVRSNRCIRAVFRKIKSNH